MRDQMIAALDFPRNLVLSLIEEHALACPRRFEAGNTTCVHCELNRPCHWAALLDDYTDFAGKPTHTINASLRYGRQLVEELGGDSGHDTANCGCEVCDWLRGAEQLIGEFEETLPANPFRPTH